MIYVYSKHVTASKDLALNYEAREVSVKIAPCLR